MALVRDSNIFFIFKDVLNDLHLITPHSIDIGFKKKGLNCFYFDDPDWVFALYHNEVNKDKSRNGNITGMRCNFCGSAEIGPDGLKIVQSKKDKRRVSMRHIGNVVIGDNVSVGSGSVIHRGLIDSTIIEDNVIIGALCNIGHNAEIRKNTIIAPGAMIGGSRIGENCFIGMGSIIRQGLKICNGVMVGMGAVVVRDIDKRGVYFGNPARYAGKWDGTW